MSTRGAIGFYVDGQKKLSYNHSDSYPSWLGVRTLEFLRGADIAAMRESAKALRLVDESQEPTDAERLRFGGVSTGADWYSLLRELQGDLDLTLRAGVALSSNDFPLDSLFCEWAYVIDLDAERFDIYEGFQRGTPTDGLWAGVPAADDEEYAPCQRVASYPLAQLPDDETVSRLEG